MILEDKIEIYSVYESSCSNCKHFDLLSFTCKAFKGGIPDEILSGENDHSKPLKDQDNDIVFEPIEKA